MRRIVWVLLCSSCQRDAVMWWTNSGFVFIESIGASRSGWRRWDKSTANQWCTKRHGANRQRSDARHNQTLQWTIDDWGICTMQTLSYSRFTQNYMTFDFSHRKTMRRDMTNFWNPKRVWHRPKVQSSTMSSSVSHCWIKFSNCIYCCASEIIRNRNSRENKSKNKSILSPKSWTPFRRLFNCRTIWWRKKPDRTLRNVHQQNRINDVVVETNKRCAIMSAFIFSLMLSIQLRLRWNRPHFSIFFVWHSNTCFAIKPQQIWSAKTSIEQSLENIQTLASFKMMNWHSFTERIRFHCNHKLLQSECLPHLLSGAKFCFRWLAHSPETRSVNKRNVISFIF